MEAVNRAFEGADAFSKMLQKVQHGAAEQRQAVARANSPEVQQWNAEVDRKRAEKLARRAAKAKP